jgi:hypothetical protein
MYRPLQRSVVQPAADPHQASTHAVPGPEGMILTECRDSACWSALVPQLLLVQISRFKTTVVYIAKLSLVTCVAVCVAHKLQWHVLCCLVYFGKGCTACGGSHQASAHSLPFVMLTDMYDHTSS